MGGKVALMESLDEDLAKSLQQEELGGLETSGATEKEADNLLKSQFLVAQLQNEEAQMAAEASLAVDAALAAALEAEAQTQLPATTTTGADTTISADAELAAALDAEERNQLDTTGADKTISVDAELAAALDQEESNKLMSCGSNASSPGIETDESLDPPLNDPEADATYAACLQTQQYEEESSMMASADGRATLLAQYVIEAVERLAETYCGDAPNVVAPIGIDDMVYTATAMMECQKTFAIQQKPTHVTIGYHYTSGSNLDSIRQNGLMSGPDRVSLKIGSSRRGGTFGEGIYTSTNPFGFQNFGDHGLMVAILKGKTKRVTGSQSRTDVDTVVGNKKYRNQTTEPPTTYEDEIVVKTSTQCLPLIRFPTTSVSKNNLGSNENHLLWQLHLDMQKAMDHFFNDSVQTTPKRVLPPGTLPPPLPPTRLPPPLLPLAASSSAMFPSVSQPPLPPQAMVQQASPTFAHAALPASVAPPPPPPVGTAPVVTPVSQLMAPGPVLGPTISFWGNRFNPSTASHPPQPAPAAAPPQRRRANFSPSSTSVPRKVVKEVIQYEAPNTLAAVSPQCLVQACQGTNESCPICLGTLSHGSVVEIKKCKHTFHYKCIDECLQRDTAKCPVCRVNLGEPQGAGPSGTMTIQPLNSKCPGFGSANTIQILYRLKGGKQRSYHANPGASYSSVSRTAYIPDNLQGQQLLQRLKYAFCKGLSFCIGTSLTTGAANVITWSSIHHKTSLSGGPHGFPDPGFIHNCNDELDALGVPDADACL